MRRLPLTAVVAWAALAGFAHGATHPTAAAGPATPGAAGLGSDDDEDSLLSLAIRANRPLARGGLDRFAGARVQLGDGSTETLDEVTRRVFAQTDRFAAQAGAARPGVLTGPPIQATEVREIEGGYAVVKSARVVVSEPEAFARQSEEFGRFMRKRRESRAPVTEATLPAECRAAFQRAWEKEIPALPAGHPLATAARQGKDAFLRALADGKGDFEVEETLIVPKTPLPEVNGILQHRAADPAGLSLTQFRPAASAALRALSRSGPTENAPALDLRRDALRPMAPQFESQVYEDSGRIRFSADFLSGFTRGSSWHWEKRWRYFSGFFRLTLGASYGVGVRIPTRVHGTLGPTRVVTRDSRDRTAAFGGEVRAETLDAPEDFYRSVGLSRDLLFDGNELVLELRVGMGYKFRAGWHDWAHLRYRTIGPPPLSRDFRPPLGRGGGVMIPIPASVSRTEIDLEVIGGYAQAGFEFSGDGTASMDYETLWQGTPLGPARTLRFSGSSPVAVGIDLPALAASESENAATARYGFRLSRPRYRWDMTVTPAIRFGIWVDAGPIERSFDSDWRRFNSLKIRLGSVEFGPHEGTRSEFTWNGGTKHFEKIVTLAPPHPDSMDARPGNAGGVPVALKCLQNGKYVRAGVGPHSQLAATSTRVGTWERFTLFDLGAGQVALRAEGNGRYVRAGFQREAWLAAMSARVDSWETFRKRDLGGGRISLFSPQAGKFVRAGMTEATLLAATSDRASRWETFIVEPLR